jgi:hypothetical protein
VTGPFAAQARGSPLAVERGRVSEEPALAVSESDRAGICGSGLSALRKLPFQPFNEFGEAQAKNLADCSELNYIHSPITTFKFAYERL